MEKSRRFFSAFRRAAEKTQLSKNKEYAQYENFPFIKISLIKSGSLMKASIDQRQITFRHAS